MAWLASLFGDPINAGTGNKYEVKTEYRGTGPFPLEFTWVYNSTGGSPLDLYSDSLLGASRTHNYDRRISAFSDGTTTVAYISRPDGKTLHFTRTGATWTAGSDIDGRLTSMRDGNDVVTSWSYRNDRNETEAFDANGQLQSITDANGHAQTISYDGSNRIASVRDMAGRQLTFTYNTTNYHLSQLTLPDGSALQFGYDANDNLQMVTYPGGTSTTYLYNEQTYTANTNLPHALTGEQDENGGTSPRYATTTYDSRGRATGTFAGANLETTTATYTDSSDGSYVGSATITYPLGKTRTLTFQTKQGRVVPSGYVDSCSGCVTPQTKVFNFYDSGHVSSTADYAGVVTTYTQDANGLETQRVESANQTATMRTILTDWDTTLRVPTQRRIFDSSASQPGTLKYKETWLYNTRGQVSFDTIIDPANGNNYRRSTFSYCEQTNIDSGQCPLLGLLITVDGARTDVTDKTWFSYYMSDDASCASAPTTCPHRKGDLWTVTNALSQVTTYLSYDGAGRPLKVQDPNGVISQFVYSPRGWLTQVVVHGIVDPNTVGADDAITTIAYEPTGTVSKVTQPDGDFLSYTYDAAHRLTDVTDNFGNTIHYTLDAAGNRTHEDTKDPGSVIKHTLARVYDQLGRLKQTLNAASQATLITYDANDNLDLISDPLNHTTNQDVDALNRPTQTTQDVGGLNVLTKYQYDARDDLVQVTDPKNLNTVYNYNGLNDLASVTSPDTGTTIYNHDSAGNRSTKVDARGITANYYYDALNRLSSIGYPASPTLNVGYTYDTVNAICATGESYAKGHLTQFNDSTGYTRFCYDRFGNLTRKQQVYSTFTQTTLFEYTLAGRLLSVTYPSGAKATYSRNADGQVTGVQLTVAGVTSTLLSNVSYYPFGPINTITFGNGRVQTRTYDQDYAPATIADPLTGGLNLTLTPDAVGNITSLVATLNGTPTTRNYTYDGLNRLKVATTPSAPSLDENFTYDATGDRLSKKIGTGATQAYVYAGTSHQLTSVAGAARTYDADGSALTLTTSGSVKTLVYDDRERMIQSKIAGVVFHNYVYNARGERVARLDPANSVNSFHYVYDESGHLLGEYGNGGGALREYVWLGDTLVGVIAASEGSTSKFEYVETDQVGTPRAVIDPVRNVAIWRWSVTGSTFGDHSPDQDADGNGVGWWFQLRYPGQYDDGGNIPYYNYFRDYESGTGRYVESDPIGLGGGFSTYGYVSGSPLRFIDPFGLEKVNFFDAIKEKEYHDLFELLPDDPLSCNIGGHGTPRTLAGLSPTDLVSQLSDSCKSKPIKLYACNTGVKPKHSKQTSFGEELHNITGQTVWAPGNWGWLFKYKQDSYSNYRIGPSRSGYDYTHTVDEINYDGWAPSVEHSSPSAGWVIFGGGP